jgi:D-glycero-D-manno-heptose 1,7-bisphosphate phosphatase
MSIDMRPAPLLNAAGSAAAQPRPAVFIDKDGTLVHDVPPNVEVDRVRLRSDAGVALGRLQRQGYALVLVSNQPGVAQGLFDEAALAAAWERLALQLALYRVAFDGIYYCPHHPDGRDPRYARECDCRKPQAGLLHRAAAEHGLDLTRSWLIGDILDDIEAGRRAGCRTVMLDVGAETEWRRGPLREPDHTARGLAEAAAWIVAQTRSAPGPATVAPPSPRGPGSGCG